MLVHDPHAVYATLKRLHVLNDNVMFWNQQHTFKLMLRNDPVDADTLACELAMVVDETDDAMATMLDLNCDGYMDEPGTYVLDTWSFSCAEFNIEDATRIMHAINNAYMMRVCGCTSYLIKDDAELCTYCELTSTPSQRAKEFCPICHVDVVVMHMAEMPCCHQRLHRHCLATWKAKSGDLRCPLCRQ